MNDPAKMDELLRSAMTPADAPALSDRFQDELHQRLAGQSLSRAKRWQLNTYVIATMLGSTLAMWWLEVPWVAIAPAVVVPAIFFVIFQQTMLPKIRN